MSQLKVMPAAELGLLDCLFAPNWEFSVPLKLAVAPSKRAIAAKTGEIDLNLITIQSSRLIFQIATRKVFSSAAIALYLVVCNICCCRLALTSGSSLLLSYHEQASAQLICIK